MMKTISTTVAIAVLYLGMVGFTDAITYPSFLAWENVKWPAGYSEAAADAAATDAGTAALFWPLYWPGHLGAEIARHVS